MNVLHRNKSWLYRKYWEEKLSLSQIAELCGCGKETIRYWMRKFDIKHRTMSEAIKISANRPEVRKRRTMQNRHNIKDKLYGDQGWLYQKYWGEKLSTVQIGKLCKVNNVTIGCWIKKHEIKIRTNSEAQNLKDRPYKHKIWLYQKYWNEELSTIQIARLCSSTQSTIGRNLKKLDIKIRTSSEGIRKRCNIKEILYQNKEWLYQKYWKEELSAFQIAKLCGVGHVTILSWMVRFKIKRRIFSKFDALYKDRDWLYQKYWGEELSAYQISTLCNGSKATIWRWLKKLKIPTKPTDHPASCRNKSKSKLGKKNPQFGKRGKESIRGNKGKRHTEEAKKKMSIAHKGVKQTEEAKKKISKANKGNTAWNKGKQCPQLGQKGQQNYFYGKHFNGEKNPRWLGGASFEPYNPEFNGKLKSFIRKRDNYTCQICDKKENGKAHCCHHIDYDKKNNRSENLITLCNSCHSKTNSNRQYWQNYFEFQQIKYWQNKEKQKELFA